MSAGRGLLLKCSWFLITSFSVFFPFAEFALHPFAIINLSFESMYILHSVSSSWEFLKLGMVLGNSFNSQTKLNV